MKLHKQNINVQEHIQDVVDTIAAEAREKGGSNPSPTLPLLHQTQPFSLIFPLLYPCTFYLWTFYLASSFLLRFSTTRFYFDTYFAHISPLCSTKKLLLSSRITSAKNRPKLQHCVAIQHSLGKSRRVMAQENRVSYPLTIPNHI